MEAEPGHSWILWTVRCGVMCYCGAVWLWSVHRLQRPWMVKAFTGLWTAAWLLVVLHVVCAFHFQHHWSHAAALTHTAEMTQRVVGWYWSGGLYINYAFLVIWAADIASLFWQRGARPTELPARRLMTVQALAAFMMFNATAVFGPGFWIPLSIVFILAVIAGRWAGWHRRPRPRPHPRQILDT